MVPTAAGIRSLVLSGSSKTSLRFLFEVRQLLFGPLEDYFDLVVSSEDGKTDTCVQSKAR